MAFYSIRVNEEGKEIETPRAPVSVRKSVTNLICETSRNSVRQEVRTITSETAVNNTNNANNNNNFKTVRYVNSAAFIEKDNNGNAVKKPLANVNEQTEENNSTAASTFNSNDLDDIDDQQYQSHIVMSRNDVPLLELNSNESFPSSNTMSYSYRKVCEVTKIIQKPDAYREWLDAKKTAKYFEKQKKKETELKQEREKEQRKLLAEEKFQEWVNKKSQIKIQEDQKKGEEAQKIKSDENEIDRCSFKKPKPDARQSENYKSWLKQKVSQQKIKKEKISKNLRIEQELELKKKKQASILYEEWLKTAPQKPKPVPLNRGMFTLKGSISKMYVNNTPWVPTDEFLQETKSL